MNARFSHAASSTSWLQRLVGDGLDALVGERLGLVGVALDQVDGGGQPLDDPLHHVGVLLEERGAHDEVGGDVLAVRPQVGFVDQHVGAALLDEAGGPGLGHPGAVDVAGDERGERLAVGLRLDRHVAAAGVVGLVALVLQPGAQGDVLGVAELRGGERLALEVRGGVDPVAHDEEGAARGAARHDADGRRRRTGAKALMAGFGPMSVMSRASANSASTASGPALNVLVSIVTLSPTFSSKSPP